jgi:hypothetical protein
MNQETRHDYNFVDENTHKNDWFGKKTIDKAMLEVRGGRPSNVRASVRHEYAMLHTLEHIMRAGVGMHGPKTN